MSTATVTSNNGKNSISEKQPHNLVWQLRKARAEWRIIFDGVSDEDGSRRLGRMNSLGWMMAHLAWHEQLIYLLLTGNMIAPELNDIAAYGAPATTPRLSEMKALWEKVIPVVDEHLATLTVADLLGHISFPNGDQIPENLGAILQRVNNHYFYHIGEASAIRQILEHTDFPEVMSDFNSVTYRPDFA